MKKDQNDKFKQTQETLRSAILAMQEVLIKNEDDFLTAPLSIEVEMGDGRYIERTNPVVQEYRALVRDYSSALKSYKELTSGQEDPEIDQLGNLRAKFKVIG